MKINTFAIVEVDARTHQLTLAARKHALLGKPFDYSFFAAAVDDLYELIKEISIGPDGEALEGPRTDHAIAVSIRCLAAVHRGDIADTLTQLTALRMHCAETTPLFRQVSHQTLRPVPVLS